MTPCNITIGSRIAVGAGIQTEDGVPAPKVIFSSTNPPSINAKIDKQDIPASGHIADAKSAKNIRKFSEPQISGSVNNEFIGVLLKATLGECTSTRLDSESDVYQHSFSVANNNCHPKLTLDFDEGGLVERQILNAMISRLQITVRNGEVASFEADFFGGFPKNISVEPVIPDEDQYDPKDISVKIEDDPRELESQKGKCVEEMTITIEKNLGQHYCLGSIDPDKSFNTQFIVTGSLTTIYEGEEYRNVWEHSEYKSIGLHFEDKLKTIGAGSHPSLFIDIPRANYTEFTTDTPESDLVRQTLVFKGYLGQQGIISAKLVNTTESY